MRTRQDQEHGDPALGTVLGIGLLALLSIVLVVAMLARMVTLLEPGLGEMAVFNPRLLAGDTLPLKAPATVVDEWGKPLGRTNCVLASDVMGATGGSLVIEARRGGSDPGYIVHWAGGPTSAAASNCGSDVDLMVAKQDLMGLVGAAGGFGLRQEARLAQNRTGDPITAALP
jgi:hypothetical protein